MHRAVGCTRGQQRSNTVGSTTVTESYLYTYLSSGDNEGKNENIRLRRKVNSGSFKGLAAGECLFLGASGSMRAGGDWEITFKFAGSPNRTNIRVGDITVPSKKGWEYLWVKYSEQEDTAAKAIVQRPVAAYVEKVYDDGDFGALGIGT